MTKMRNMCFVSQGISYLGRFFLGGRSLGLLGGFFLLLTAKRNPVVGKDNVSVVVSLVVCCDLEISSLWST